MMRYLLRKIKRSWIASVQQPAAKRALSARCAYKQQHSRKMQAWGGIGRQLALHQYLVLHLSLRCLHFHKHAARINNSSAGRPFEIVIDGHAGYVRLQLAFAVQHVAVMFVDVAVAPHLAWST